MQRPTVGQSGDLVGSGAPVASPHNLPEELSSFIGRSGELARLREVLSEARLVSLVGAGGAGKTRLALQGAAAAIERFPDGAWWVPLAALEDRELLTTTVGGALGLRERPGQGPLDVLRAHLRERRALLVLDNCEHQLEPCAELIEALLGSCPELVVLATSREALGLPAEVVFRVPSLQLPKLPATPEAVMESDAGRLFADRAVRARANFTVTDANAAAVTAICRGVDGIPLAIELAAARVRMMSPGEIAGRLDDRFPLLSDGSRAATSRHWTLQASIDWSHELCSEPERVLLRRLSVWTGGWALAGAEVVSAGGGLDRRAILGLLSGLLDKSLLDTEERGDEIRFRMLETIRQYAAERLSEAGETDAIRTQHLRWCVQMAETAEPELVRHDGDLWLRRLEPEAPNLRAALEWAVAIDGEMALRLAAAQTFFWLRQGRLEEGIAALERALTTASKPSATRGKVLWGLGYLKLFCGQFEACLEYADRALVDGEAVGDRSVMARALTARGQILSVTNPLHGREPLERSLELACEAGDEWCAIDATRMLGGGYMRQSEHDLARPIQEDGYARARALGYRPFDAWYFFQRATGELEHGRLPAARELAEQAVARSNEVGELVAIGRATALLVECDVLQGASGQGRARAAPCVEIMRSAGVRTAEIWLQSTLALVDVAEGSADAARARIAAAVPLIDAAPGYDVVARTRRALAVALLLSGDLDGAIGEAERLLSHARTGRNEHVEVLSHHLLGRVALARGEVLAAGGHLHEALAIAIRRDFPLQTLDSLESLAHVAALTESPAEAARRLAAVRAGRARLGTVRWPPEPEVWARIEAEVREALGDDAFAVASAEGAALSIEEAGGYATRARGSRKRPPRGWDSLTPTELDVARHAAAGLTNPQIGARMFIARGTVKAHLAHIFAKLGISSRAELAAEATRRGLDGPEGTNPVTR